MAKQEYVEILESEYQRIINKLELMKSEEEFRSAHEKLINKKSVNGSYEIKDCAVNFIEAFFNLEWGRSYVFLYTNGAKKFIHSKYLSDYFKNSIKSLLTCEDEVEAEENKLHIILNGDKLINDMTLDELQLLYDSITAFYKSVDGDVAPNIASSFVTFLYKLDGKAVQQFIKKNIDNNELAKQILLTSGLHYSGSYYSGRGVNLGDLNSTNLISIFEKLFKLDINYAYMFVKMIKNMKTLGATEVINSFYNLASNEFVLADSTVKEKNISLDGSYGKGREIVAVASFVSAMHRSGNNEYQVEASEQIKNSFIVYVTPILKEVDLDIESAPAQSDETIKRRRNI